MSQLSIPARLRVAVSAVLAGVMAGLAPGAVPAQAVPGVPAPLFDPNSVSWLSLRDQTSAQFAASFSANSGNGFLIVDLDIDTTGGNYRVGSVWQRNTDGRAWQELRDLTDAQFHQAWTDAGNRGLRLTEQETYVVAGQRLWAGVWMDDDNLSWASYRNLTSAQFSQVFDEQSRAGRMPVDFDEYDTSQGPLYSVVWVQNLHGQAWQLWRDMTSAQFSAKFTELQREYRMLTTESVRLAAGQRYAGIWLANTNGRGWFERRDLTSQGFANWWHRYADMGYRLVAYNKYDTAGGTRHSGVWRQNEDNRPNWALRAAVDTRVQSELDTTAVPGIGVAVFHNGTARYTRGFGFADINDNVWMDSEHVGSLGSVSKAVGGVLTMRMVEQNLVELDDDSRDWVPAMPAHHTHTVGDLIANRGCVGHYGDINTGAFDNTPYATALDAAEEFWDEPLVCTPPDYYYSSPGYTIAGAVLEAAGGDDIKALVRNKLTNPFGLGTLAPQDLGDSSVRRMTIYTDGDAEVAIENKDWKVLGGGIDSDIYDLGRFGAKLAAGQILTQASLDTMWTPPDADSSYAYGWSTGTEDGHQVVAKDGSWTGNLAYLRIYPDDQIVVAVMMNDRSGTQSAVQLGRDIGAIVLDSLP